MATDALYLKGHATMSEHCKEGENIAAVVLTIEGLHFPETSGSVEYQVSWRLHGSSTDTSINTDHFDGTSFTKVGTTKNMVSFKSEFRMPGRLVSLPRRKKRG